MAIKPGPEVMKLKSILLTSGLQMQNQPLFHVIDQLINAINEWMNNIQEAVDPTLSGNILTHRPETTTLPNSRELMPGQGISFQDIYKQRFIHAQIPFPMDGFEGEDGQMGPQGPPGATGAAGIPGAPGANAVSFFYAFEGIDGEDAPILPGPTGPSGPIGATGPQGTMGLMGLDGADGEAGEDSYIPGPQGIQGPTGPAGSGSGGTAMPLPVEFEPEYIEPPPASPYTKVKFLSNLVRMIPFTVNLGSTPNWRGQFSLSSGLHTQGYLTDLSQLAAIQAQGPYSGKGNRADEAEMDRVHFIVKSWSGSTGIIDFIWTTEQRYAPDTGNAREGEAVALTPTLFISRTRNPTGVRRAGYVKGNFNIWLFVGDPLTTSLPLTG